MPFEMAVRAMHQEVCHQLMAQALDLWQERFDLLLDTKLYEDCVVEEDRL